MVEIKLDKNSRIEVLQAAIEVLNKGGIIIYPTETAYGLGCDFYNHQARNKIYAIKKRDKKNILPVIVPDLITATSLVDFSSTARRLAMEYWPGPLTLVLPYKYYKINDHGDDYLALRVSNHPFVSLLAVNFAKPIVSTSANVSGQPNCYSPEDIKKQFVDSKIQPDLFINAGKLLKVKPSTIVKVIKDKIEVLRQGDIKI